MKKLIGILALAVCLFPCAARADSTAAVLDVNGHAVCRVVVTNSQNPTVYPDNTPSNPYYQFDWDWMENHNPPLYCTVPLQGWVYIGTWMGV